MGTPENTIQEWILRDDPESPLDLCDRGLSRHPIYPDSVTTLRLDRNNLHIIKSLPPDIRELSIRYNKVEYIRCVFPNTLTALYLNGNQLKNLPSLPDSIRILEISYNYLSDIRNIPSRLEVLFYHHNLFDAEMRDVDTVSEYAGCDHSMKIARLREQLAERHRIVAEERSAREVRMREIEIWLVTTYGEDGARIRMPRPRINSANQDTE